jgi:hypothetical protein
MEKRRSLTAWILVCLTFGGGVFGENRFSSRQWIARAGVFLEDEEGARAYYLPVTPGILSLLLPDFADLRIVNADGREIPFVIQEMRGSEKVQTFLLEPPRKPEAQVREMEGRIQAPPHTLINRVLLVCTGLFTSTAVVRVSHDGRHWREVAREFVFRTPLIYPDRTPVEKLSIHFSETEAAYIGVRLEDFARWTDDENQEPFQLFTIQPEYVEKTPATYAGVEQGISRLEDVKEGVWSWDIRVPSGVSAHHLEVSVAEPDYEAEYGVSALWRMTGAGTRTGRVLGSGEIARRKGLPGNPIHIPLSSAPLPARIRFTMEPRPGHGLTVTYISVRAMEKRILFPPGGKTPYTLYLRNPTARPPRYAERVTTELLKNRNPAAATLAQITPNPDYRPPALPRTFKAPGTFPIIAGVFAIPVAVYVLARLRRTRRMKSRRASRTTESA